MGKWGFMLDHEGNQKGMRYHQREFCMMGDQSVRWLFGGDVSLVYVTVHRNYGLGGRTMSEIQCWMHRTRGWKTANAAVVYLVLLYKHDVLPLWQSTSRLLTDWNGRFMKSSRLAAVAAAALANTYIIFHIMTPKLTLLWTSACLKLMYICVQPTFNISTGNN
jgi:hypothetical protein